MTEFSAVELLALFNEKAAQFCRAKAFTAAGGIGALIEFDCDGGWDGVYVGPGDEEIREAVLTLRLFMQDNDALSLKRMRSALASLGRRPDLSARFDSVCEALNLYLDSDTPLSISDTRPLTYREILHIFLYGEYAHVKHMHRTTFIGIRGTPFFPLFQAALSGALRQFRDTLVELSRVNDELIADLKSQGGAV